MTESKLDEVISRCERAIHNPSPTIIESKMFYEKVLELVKEQQEEIDELSFQLYG